MNDMAEALTWAARQSEQTMRYALMTIAHIHGAGKTATRFQMAAIQNVNNMREFLNLAAHNEEKKTIELLKSVASEGAAPWARIGLPEDNATNAILLGWIPIIEELRSRWKRHWSEIDPQWMQNLCCPNVKWKETLQKLVPKELEHMEKMEAKRNEQVQPERKVQIKRPEHERRKEKAKPKPINVPDIDPIPSKAKGRNRLAESILNGDVDQARRRYNSPDEDPAAQDEHGRTCLALALQGKLKADIRHSLVILLLHENYDNDLFQPDKQGLTPLMLAARIGDQGIFELIRGKVGEKSLEARDKAGRCIISHAVMAPAESLGILEMLVTSTKLPLNIVDNSGRTPFMWATIKCKSGALRVLEESGKDLAKDAKDGDGRSAESYKKQLSKSAAIIDCLT